MLSFRYHLDQGDGIATAQNSPSDLDRRRIHVGQLLFVGSILLRWIANSRKQYVDVACLKRYFYRQEVCAWEVFENQATDGSDLEIPIDEAVLWDNFVHFFVRWTKSLVDIFGQATPYVD